MDGDGRRRVVVQGVTPEIDCGRFHIKRVVDEEVEVTADIFADGHDRVAALVAHRKRGEERWHRSAMNALGNDRWRGSFVVREIGVYEYTVEAWPDHFLTWQDDLRKKHQAGLSIGLELDMGVELIEQGAARADERPGHRVRLEEWARSIREEKDRTRAVALAQDPDLAELMSRYHDPELTVTYERLLLVTVDRKKALYSTWYELFPRSWAAEPGKHGTFEDCERLLPEIARMGFDVLYLPPIHPIGHTNRKGRNNSPNAGPDDPGSPWAIGSEQGGHTAIHPELGTLEELRRLIERAAGYGIEVALDIAFQCSMDHPYIKSHPKWFTWRPDGTIQFAENPPKKYEDIVPINFETEDWQALWRELDRVVRFWVAQGITIFRVDNPHTKPFRFWEWLISGIKRDHPKTIFLSEAFTRPKVMYELAKRGFSQSYTYFTWRNTASELTQYLTELTRSGVREVLRPNFWPNTPDILPEFLQYGGRPAFVIRLILAATLSSSYGIYGPAFELGVSEAVEGKEEYLDSEKYELKDWQWDRPGNLKRLIERVNRIRRTNPALQQTNNLRFLGTDNERVLLYSKADDELSNVIFVAVSLDPFHAQSATIRVPLSELGLSPQQPYLVHELLGDEKHIWQGEQNRIDLEPNVSPAQIFMLRRRLRREADFDYYM
jgi:starch synthase (maltosyl-transferring)